MKFSQTLDTIMKNRNITNYQMSKETGISDSLISYWRKGERTPKMDNFITVANFLGVSLDYLAGRTTEPEVEKSQNVVNFSSKGDNNTNSVTVNTETFDKDTLEIARMIKDLPLIERSEIVVMIKKMKSNNEEALK
ncbi:MAG: helix-turn-helix domain-containing protein [Oscillospiraceae bacterium]|nr:helix-turn-helix domain-containing protein [Oscillospiraceae bacterium]